MKIQLYEAGKNKPELSIVMPLSGLHLAKKLLPRKTKLFLDKVEIDLAGFSELLSQKGPKGPLLEIEDKEEKLIITIE
ncbi:MAG: hypothetical protein GY795_05695 [Desulfobacterales bacterium]|nr:hypothetical protein [Desulfobacterales bacterium]